MIFVVAQVWVLWLVLVIILGALVYAFFLKKKVDKADPGNADMLAVQGYIKEGASAFIKRQYMTLAIAVGVLAIIISLVFGLTGAKWYWMVLAYIAGSSASAFAGWLGMKVGVDANAKTAQAATKGLTAAFDVSFFGGTVMGLICAGSALFGVWFIYMISGRPEYILGFSFGASTIALFAKAGGGIYTKTADVAADLVGKIEYSLPEDDPRNPAAVADNVGDNVGDIAGMGADLFDSYVASLVAAITLTFAITRAPNPLGFTSVDATIFASFPIAISGAGLLASMVGIFIISRVEKQSPGKALNFGTFLATGLFIAISALFTFFVRLSPGISVALRPLLWRNFVAGVLGVLSGLVIGLTTDYFTDDAKRPVQATAEASQQGHALNILSGFSYGLISVAPPTIGIVIAMVVAYLMNGVVGVANAAVGMLAIVGTIVSNDAYGPITDNARGIAEQGHLDESVIALCDKLDSAGNTAKAITKGFAIGAAALTVLALLYSFMEEAADKIRNLGLIFEEQLDLIKAPVMIGALLGVMIPCIYSAVLIFAVQKNAQLMVKEIRRQFEENPAILEGNANADFAKCVDIATKGALKELMVPILLAIGSPILVGVLLGVHALGAFLAGTILIGFVFGILLSNTGGLWDNAKKYIEDGHLGGKGTLAHAAAVTGDTVGDPFKDTAGPAINTLICVLSLTASMFLPLFIQIDSGYGLLGRILFSW